MPTAEQERAIDHGTKPLAELAEGVRYAWGDDRAPLPPLPPLAVASDREVPRAHDSPPASSAAVAAGPSSPRWRQFGTWRWMMILGGLGFAAGAIGGGAMARNMGYDWRLAAQIGALVGAAAAGTGAMLPPLVRALGWTALAAACGASGGLALWLLTRVAPAFVERFLP